MIEVKIGILVVLMSVLFGVFGIMCLSLDG